MELLVSLVDLALRAGVIQCTECMLNIPQQIRN